MSNGILKMTADRYSDLHKIHCEIGFEIPPHRLYNHDPMKQGRDTWIFYDQGYVIRSCEFDVHHAYLEGLRKFRRKLDEWILIMEYVLKKANNPPQTNHDQPNHHHP